MYSLAHIKTKRIPLNRRSSLAAPKDSISDIERGFADDEYSGDEFVTASGIELDDEEYASDVPTLVASTPTISQQSAASSDSESSASASASSTSSSDEVMVDKAEQSSSESSPSTGDWDADLSSEECSE